MTSMQRPNIFIYDSIPSPSRQRGVMRYFRYVTDGLIASFGERVTIFSAKARDYGPARHIRALPPDFRGSERLKIRKVNELLAGRLAKRERAAVFFSPYYGNAQTTAAQVFTVYDMIYELYPQYFPRTSHVQSFICEKRRCLERAVLLLAISQSTARDIAACYPNIDSGKIVTTWLGVDEFFLAASRQPNHNHRPYFLYVGDRRGYKNFWRLLQAFGQSGLARDFDLRIISPGRAGLSAEEVDLLRRYHLEKSVKLRLAVSEAELRENYAGAAALVYPSEYEGFGLPILEALASGTLVATSNAASMPEVGGEAAFYFDPCSVDSIAATLQHVAALSEGERCARIAQGIARARTFAWVRCQQQTVEAIRKLL